LIQIALEPRAHFWLESILPLSENVGHLGFWEKFMVLAKKRASTQKHYEVTYKNLPLSCPMPDMRLWDAHPKVYLPIEVTGYEVCPYCGSKYTLKDFDPKQPIEEVWNQEE
jgi:uncharacterized Zn-finger protein